MLLFSHNFARAFFREGERIRFIQPALAYQRIGPNGTVKSVQRRAHTRQSNREDVWLYHLREMATADEPLRYIRRYLLLEETMHDAQQLPRPPAALPYTSTNAGETLELPSDYDEELLVRD